MMQTRQFSEGHRLWRVFVIGLLALATAAAATRTAVAPAQPVAQPAQSPTKPGDANPAVPTKLEPLRLLLDYAYHSGGHTPWFVGRDKGFFRDAGLDLDLEPSTGSVDTVRLVGIGRAPIGYADAGSMLLGIAEGIPVTMVAVVYQKSPLCIFSLKSKNIARPKDLEGKTLGLAPGQADAKIFPAFAKKNNLDLSKITTVNLSYTTRTPSLVGGNVDALTGFIMELPVIRAAANADVNVLRVVDYGVVIYGSGFIVSNDFAVKNPRIVERFIQAAMRSLDYTIKHRDEAVQITLKALPNVPFREVAGRIDAIMPYFESEETRRNGLGWMDDSVWKATQDIMVEYGGQTKAVDLTKVYTNKYLKPAGR